MKLWFLYDVCLFMFGISVLGAAIYAFLFRLAGIRIKTVQIGSFGRPFQWKLKSLIIKFGWLPLHSSVEVDIPGYRAKPLWMRISLQFCAPLLMFGLACTVLGISGGWHHVLTAWWQWPRGAFEPMAVAVPLVGQWYSILSVSQIQAAAILMAKIAAFDVSPVGGAFNRAGMQWLCTDDSERQAFTIFTGLMVAGLLMYILWTYAVIRFTVG